MFHLTKAIRRTNPTLSRLLSTNKDNIVSANKPTVVKSVYAELNTVANRLLATTGLTVASIFGYYYYNEYTLDQQQKKERKDRLDAKKKAEKDEETRILNIISQIQPITKKSLKTYTEKLNSDDLTKIKEELYKVDIEKMAVLAVENRTNTFKLNH